MLKKCLISFVFAFGVLSLTGFTALAAQVNKKFCSEVSSEPSYYSDEEVDSCLKFQSDYIFKLEKQIGSKNLKDISTVESTQLDTSPTTSTTLYNSKIITEGQTSDNYFDSKMIFEGQTSDN